MTSSGRPIGPNKAQRGSQLTAIDVSRSSQAQGVMRVSVSGEPQRHSSRRVEVRCGWLSTETGQITNNKPCRALGIFFQAEITRARVGKPTTLSRTRSRSSEGDDDGIKWSSSQGQAPLSLLGILLPELVDLVEGRGSALGDLHYNIAPSYF